MARGVVGLRFSLLFTALSLLQPGWKAVANEDCVVTASDRLLFYTIKPDCSIRVATGAIPSAQFKPSNDTACVDASDVRHGTFTSDANQGILVMYRNPPRWIVHLIAVTPLPTAAFSMAIGDEDYFLEESSEIDACGVGREKSLLCISSSVDRRSLRLARYEQLGQNYTPVATTTLALRHGVLASDARILSLHEAGNGTINVRVWSEGERKLAMITISPDLVIEAVRKQLLRKEVWPIPKCERMGSVIAADDDTTLARSCDERGCRTLMRGAKDKGFHCIDASSNQLSTLGVVVLPPLEGEEQMEHRILKRATQAKNGKKSKKHEPTEKEKNASDLMMAEKFDVYETLLDITQEGNEPSTIGGIQAIVTFLYLLIFTLVMFIRTVDDDRESLRFTTVERAQLHSFDYIQQQEDAKQEDAKKERERTEEAREESVQAPEPIRHESSAPPSESGTNKKIPATASSGPITPALPSRSATTVTQQTTTQLAPTVVPSASAVSSAESVTKPTEDNFLHDEDAVAAGIKKKPEQHSLGSMEAMVAAPPPQPAPRKLMQTKASGVSPDLTTASRVEQQQPPPPAAPVAAEQPQKSRSNLKPVTDRPPSRRLSPSVVQPPQQQKRTSSAAMLKPPTCQHHYVSPGGYSTCTALCSQVSDFNRQYAMGLGRSGAPLMAESNSDRERKE